MMQKLHNKSKPEAIKSLHSPLKQLVNDLTEIQPSL